MKSGEDLADDDQIIEVNRLKSLMGNIFIILATDFAMNNRIISIVITIILL